MSKLLFSNSGFSEWFHCLSWFARRCSAAWILSLAFFVVHASSLNAAGKPKEFKAAIAALDQEEWEKVTRLLNQAMQKQQGDGERLRLYGKRFVSYLPHYYLGFALYKQGNCDGALKEWSQSLSDEPVQGTPEYEALLKYQKDCDKALH